MAISKRQPPPVPHISNMNWEQAKWLLETFLHQSAFARYESLPGPHGATHLGGSDDISRSDTPSPISIGATGSGNSIEGNLVTNSAVGINFSSSQNVYANNRALYNTTNYGGSGNGQAVSSTASWGPYEHLHPSVWASTSSGDANYHIGEDYRRCCTSIAWIGEGLAARMMHAEEFWNHDPFFEYVDRWMTENDAAAVATIQSATGLNYSADWQRQGQAWDAFVEDMWAAYRNNLPPEAVESGGAHAEGFLLLQNYPNPFNPGTTIEYDIPARCQVSLAVFDMLGREVSVLVDRMEEPGRKSVRFEGGGLAGGVYFYRLRAGDHTETRRLVVLR